jgi:clan AA aspartic protease
MTPKVQITVQGQVRSVEIEAIIDTGFAGRVCLPMDVAVQIGAQVAGWREMLLADGRVSRRPSVLCEVDLLGMTFSNVEAFVTEEYGDPIIGMELLEGCQLTLDFDSGSVQLKRKEP